MSLLSIDRLLISLSPGGVQLARVGGFWHRRCVDRSIVPLPENSNALDWQPCLQALRTALEDSRWRGLPLWIVVSDCFVRYQLIPVRPELSSTSEKLEYARFHFHQVYGGLSDQWEIVIDPALPGTPMIACAIDRELIAGLKALAEQTRTRIRGLAPRFAVVANKLRKRLRTAKNEAFYLAMFEVGGLTLGAVAGQHWKSIRQRFISQSPADSLRDALDQDGLLQAQSEGARTVYIIGTEKGDPAFAEKIGSNWILQHLDFPDSLSDRSKK